MGIAVDGDDGVVNGGGLNVVIREPPTHIGILWK